MMAKKRTVKQQELLVEYRKQIKIANRRLQRLEKLAEQPEYENVLKYAYRNAERDIKELGIGDISKVRYRIPENTNKLESALRRVKHFNEDLKTTTKSDIDKVYRRDAVNFNKSFGTNFTWDEVKRFTDAVDWERLKKDRGSAVLQKVIKSIMENKVSPDEIQDAIDKHKTIKGQDEVESDWTKRLIEDGLDVSMLYEGTGDFEAADDNPFN